jgi:TonB-dependent SusC/RagA subfamily outer membrane receptor
VDGIIVSSLSDINPDDIAQMQILKNAEAIALYGAQAAKGVIIVTTKSGAKNKNDFSKIETRKNFNETAFFLPDLKTDSSGNISFSFTMPEALTQWKFQALAHTKDLAFGYSTKNIITQKELMLQPNAPRFLREGDRIELSSKVVNMSEKELTGTVQLELLNASNMQPVDGWFENMYPTQYFTAER